MREVQRFTGGPTRPASRHLRARPAPAGWRVEGRRVAERISSARLEHSCHRSAQDHQSCGRQPLRALGLLGAVVGARGSDGGVAK